MSGFPLLPVPISLKLKIHLAWTDAGSLPNWVAVSSLSYLFIFLDGLQTRLTKGHKGVGMGFFPGPVCGGRGCRARLAVSTTTISFRKPPLGHRAHWAGCCPRWSAQPTVSVPAAHAAQSRTEVHGQPSACWEGGGGLKVTFSQVPGSIVSYLSHFLNACQLF